MRAALRELCLLAAAAALAAPAAEVYLRLCRPQTLSSPQREVRFGMINFPAASRVVDKGPGYDASYTMNGDGFRGPERPTAKPSGLTRAVFLGSSYTFGLCVNDDQTFVSLSEQRLNAAGGRFEAVNLGWAWTTIEFHEWLYHHVARAYRPDIVVLELYIDPKLRWTYETLGQWDRTRGPVAERFARYVAMQRPLLRVPGYVFLCERSHLWALLGQALADHLHRTHPEWWRFSVEPTPMERVAESYIRVLDRLVSAARADGAWVVLATEPRIFAKDYPSIEEHVHRLASAQRGVSLIELAIPQEDRISAVNEHLNPAGHEVWAARLSELLARIAVQRHAVP